MLLNHNLSIICNSTTIVELKHSIHTVCWIKTSNKIERRDIELRCGFTPWVVAVFIHKILWTD